jgi:hypothetical protein
MDENTALALIQTLHNLGGILFAAGPFYALLLLRQQRGGTAQTVIEAHLARLPRLWFWLLLLQLASGAGFGAASLIFHGEFPAMGSVARIAITVKVTAVMMALVLCHLLWRSIMPALMNESGSDATRRDALRLKRARLLYLLMLLALAILTGAAFLRWNM